MEQAKKYRDKLAELFPEQFRGKAHIHEADYLIKRAQEAQEEKERLKKEQEEKAKKAAEQKK